MNTIGAFTRTGDIFQGEIITLSVQSTDVRIVPNLGTAGANRPSHLVQVGQATVGQGWPADPASGAVLSLMLDDPSFVGPIRALLFADERADRFKLIWSRTH